MLLYVFLAVYSTLCSPQPSDTVFSPNVDVMFSWKPSDSENSGSGQDTFVSSPPAAVEIFAGHITRSGGLVSDEDKNIKEHTYVYVTANVIFSHLLRSLLTVFLMECKN